MALLPSGKMRSTLDTALMSNPMTSSVGAADALTQPGMKKDITKGAEKIDPYKKQTLDKPEAAPQIGKQKFEDLGVSNASSQISDPRAAMINMAPQDQFRQQQLSVAQRLAAQAQGQGPSIANEQMKQGQEAAMAQQFAQLASARGGASPALARAAMQNNAAQQGQLSQQAGINRLQEQQQAAGNFNNVAGTARGQDVNLATSQAGMEQATNMAKYQGDLSSAQQFNDMKMKYAAQGLDADKANQMAALELQKIKLNQSNAQLAADQKRREGILGTVGQAGGAIAAMI